MSLHVLPKMIIEMLSENEREREREGKCVYYVTKGGQNMRSKQNVEYTKT